MMLQRSSVRLLWEPWLASAHERPDAPCVTHWSLTAPPVRWSNKSLVVAADLVSRRLRETGVRPGDVCAIILRHRMEFYPIYLGIVMSGAVPAVLPYPNARLHPDKFRSGLQGMLARSGFDWLLTEPDLMQVIGDVCAEAGERLRGILFPTDWVEAPESYRSRNAPKEPLHRGSPDDGCVLQHSSGTTGLQKPILLSHRQVLTHLENYKAAIEARADDAVASWLPLYHDMGLIAGFHLPLNAGMPLVQLNPFEWVQAPISLLQVISEHRSTLCWLPNFAYNLMAKRADPEELKGVRLDSVRMFVNCSERVRADSHRLFLETFAAYGLDPEALGASYAMAEATFAVTQTVPGQSSRVVHADLAALSRGRFVPCSPTDAKASAWPSSGRLIDGCDVRIVDASGADLAEGGVGNILVRSQSLFDGYRNNPEKTREAFRDGWYVSGDIGFWVDGELYVIGRSKDVIIVAGKNIYPEDIEAAVNELPGVIAGRVVAFGVESDNAGTEEIWVVAESHHSENDQLNALRRDVLKAGIRMDVTIARVVFVPPRWLIKSSSGKISRQANRERARQLHRN